MNDSTTTWTAGATPPAPLRERSLAGLVFLLTIALALRIIWVGLVRNEQVADFQTYDAMAASFYRGQGYTDLLGKPSAFKPPGYPLFLAGIYHVVGENQFAAKVVQANLSTVLCLLVFLIVRRLFDDTRAFIALMLAALHPTFIYSTTLLGTEIPFTCLVVGGIYLMIRHDPYGDVPLGSAAMAGLLFGMAALMRPMALLAPLALALWLIAHWRGTTETAALFLTFCGALALPVLPWTIRNYVHFERVIPVSTNGGLNLLYGHNPLGEIVWFPEERLHSIPGFPAPERWRAMDESERNATAQRLALDYMGTDPAGIFRRMPGKFYLLMLSPDVPGLYWNVEGLPEDQRPREATLTLLASLNRIFTYGLLALFTLGVIIDGRSDPRHLFLYGLIGTWTAFHVLYWGKPRFRFPLEPLLIVFAAGPLAAISTALKQRRR